jgi:sRNA-binding regulator protein Hfq
LSEFPPLSSGELSRIPAGALKAFKAKDRYNVCIFRGRILLYGSFTDSAHISRQEPHGRSAAGPKPAQFDVDAPLRHAELFYLQKQIQLQTPMVIVLEDGEQVDGCIEWYDRNTLKVRGKTKTLIYKSAIKYMYKLGDVGQ